MSERDFVCPGCNGRVSLPPRSRTFTLDQIIEHHKVSCPARGVSRDKKGVPDEEAATT